MYFYTHTHTHKRILCMPGSCVGDQPQLQHDVDGQKRVGCLGFVGLDAPDCVKAMARLTVGVRCWVVLFVSLSLSLTNSLTHSPDELRERARDRSIQCSQLLEEFSS